MLRYSILVLSAVLAISAAASAQISVTIGGGQNGYYPNQYPYNQPAYYPNPGYYPTQGYVNNNGCPPGHYYCNDHRSYCSHPQNGYYGNNGNHKHKKNRGRWGWQGNNNQNCRR